jgi:Fe-Mn family superoxide dismutase
MLEITRRTMMKGMTLSAALPVLGATTLAQAQQQNVSDIPDAFSNEHIVKPLSFDPADLDGLSERLIMSHWQNNYSGSVAALNGIKQRLAAALADDALPAYVYNDLKREHLLRTGSVVLHELYFDNIRATQPRDGELDRALGSAFGSAQMWEKEFRRIAAGLGGGSGWVMLGWNTHAGTLENYWMADHMNAPVAVRPIVVMDMYEHSYHMDFGADAAQYIEAFMRNINWGVAAERLSVARQV